MKQVFLSMIAVAVLLSACDKIDRFTNNKPYLELSGSGPFELEITDFTWGYGITAFNQFSGDFEKLDKKIYNLLKGKEGLCKVYLEAKVTDKYGKENTSTNYVGDLDLSELNRYKNWEFWHKNAGIKSLLYKKYVQQSSVDTAEIIYYPNLFRTEEGADSAIHDVPESQKKTIEVNETKHSGAIKTFSLEHTDLYPNEKHRAAHDYQSYTNRITGTIKAADFYHGSLEVQGDDGDNYALRIQPDNLPTSLKSDLRYFLKVGNAISCICTAAGARELIIVSATFTDKQ